MTIMLFRKVIIAGVLYMTLTVVLGFLETRYPGTQGQPTWRRESRLDSFYWFFTLTFTHLLSTVCIALVVVPVYWFLGRSLAPDVLAMGYGRLSQIPHWLQGLIIIFIGDFVGYWTHRWLHVGPWWDIHAIHHSSQEVSWLSSTRVHPFNDVVSRTAQSLPILFLGFAPVSVEIYAPLLTAYLGFTHANVPWNYGPFRYVLVSPVFHRWHHSCEPAAIDTNFAGLFPIFDWLFGTFYLPRDRQPQQFGLVGETIPSHFWSHLIYPWRDRRVPLASAQPSEIEPPQ